MLWWQYLVISSVSVVLGAFLGYWLNRRGAKDERTAIERRQMRDAMQGLLTEIRANLELVEESPEPGLLPLLAKDMWNIHKSKIVQLPSGIQESLYRAYSGIDKVNAVVDVMHAFGSRQGYGPGTWDRRYGDEAKKARELMEKARDSLKQHLKDEVN